MVEATPKCPRCGSQDCPAAKDWHESCPSDDVLPGGTILGPDGPVLPHEQYKKPGYCPGCAEPKHKCACPPVFATIKGVRHHFWRDEAEAALSALQAAIRPEARPSPEDEKQVIGRWLDEFSEGVEARDIAIEDVLDLLGRLRRGTP